MCTGRELVARLEQQIAPFKPALHLGQQIESLHATPDGAWHVQSHTGTQWLAKTVFIAAGVGAFVPRSLPIEGLAPHLNQQVWFGSQALPDFKDQHVVIAGDSDCKPSKRHGLLGTLALCLGKSPPCTRTTNACKPCIT